MKKWMLLGLFCFLLLLLKGQNADIKFSHLFVKNGLSQGWIRCIIQDKYGFLWFGTGDGLNKFDGYKFKIYKNSPGNHNSLVNNNIRKIFQDSKGNLWIATQGGLNIYNREMDNFIPVTSTFKHSVEDICENDSGDLLIATPEGLFLLNSGSFALSPLIGAIYVSVIQKDAYSNFLIGTYNGLYKLQASTYAYKVIKLDENPGTIDINIRAIYRDSEDNIWLGTNYSGLLKLETKDAGYNEIKITKFIYNQNDKSSINSGAILSIIEDDADRLWIGVENGGLNMLDLNSLSSQKISFNRYVNDPMDNESISNNSIQSLYIDDQNTLWIGTYGDGLNYYNKLLHKFATIKKQASTGNTLSDNHINVLYNEKDYLWIGTENGLNVYDKKNNSYRHYVHENNNPYSISANAIWSIFRDSRGNMWIGTWAGGLNLMDEKNGTFKYFQYRANDEASIGGNNVFQIIETHDKELWIASMSGGVNKYNYQTGKFQRFLHNPFKNSLSNNWVGNIMEYNSNEIWIATSNSVDVYNKKTAKFISFRNDIANKKSISCNGAIELFTDSRKNIWIGTESGLNLFHRKDSSFTYYREEDGLPNNTINAICEDRYNNLWLSTNNGISKFVNGVNLPQNPEFINFDESDGLQSNEFVRISKCQDENGNIYFGGTNGFNIISPESLKQNSYKPTVVLTEFLLFNKPVKAGKNTPLKQDISLTTEIVLDNKQTVFTLEFAALNYISPEKSQYAYILEGFEKNWNFVGAQRIATYTNLSPGKYIFKVKASNNDGIWNEKYTALVIEILPPWWQTWWAKILYFIIIIAALYFFRKYTIISLNVKNQLLLEHIEKQKSEEINKLKMQFFTNISHELRTPLSLILSPLETIINSTKEKPDDKNKLILVYRNAERLFRLANDLMDFVKFDESKLDIKVQHGNIVKFTHEIFAYFNELAVRQQIDYKFNAETSEVNTWFDRDKIEKIVQNLLSNSFKHTPFKGKIVVSIKHLLPEQIQNNAAKIGREYVCISVTDNGPGIAHEFHEKIFKRFYQVPAKDNSFLTGTGIGLALTKSLVELHHGFITVKSEAWKETIFSVYLPIGRDLYKASEIIDKPVDIDTKTIKPPKNWNNNLNEKQQELKYGISKILVVEDNIELREYLVSRLSENYNVIDADNGRSGYEKVTEHEPDLIISDILMPEVTGIEMCKKIRENVTFSHIPVILLTAKATIDDKITGIETGADAYITKPFNVQYLEVVIRKLIETRKSLFQRFSHDIYILPKEMSGNPVDQKFLEKTVNYIHDNIANPELSVDNLAHALCVSKSTAYRKIQSLTGQSVNDFIQIVRLKMAVKLIEEGNLTISEIAYDVGFTSPAYFTKCFKEHYGKLPSFYKKNKNDVLGEKNK